ncbi:MAG TPA: hypothetical protein VH391_09625 [Solirubrobacterales bacterium]|jgi:hypothetical protein
MERGATKSKRRPLAIGLIVALALLGSLLVATQVLGRGDRTVVKDKRGDGGAFVPRTRPKVCDIVRATSELAKQGHLRHAVTVRGKINLHENAPPVIITNHRVHGPIGLASFILAPGEPKVYSHLRDHRRTVVYFVKRSLIANAVGRHDKYFWVADQCPIHDDRAPNHRSAVQPLHGRHHQR